MSVRWHSAPESEPGLSSRGDRLIIDAPLRAFHWLFALSFAGAWLTAESNRWRGVHVTLGYAFGGLLLLRWLYGVIGPRQARFAQLWRRAAGVGEWLRLARTGHVDLARATTIGMGVAMLLLVTAPLPLVAAGYAGHVDWLGIGGAMEEVHEFFANVLLALVMAHLALIALLSTLRRRNLAASMWTGRVLGPGPDLVKANRRWLAVLVLLAYLGFVGWQVAQGDAVGRTSTHRGVHDEHRGRTVRAEEAVPAARGGPERLEVRPDERQRVPVQPG